MSAGAPGTATTGDDLESATTGDDLGSATTNNVAAARAVPTAEPGLPVHGGDLAAVGRRFGIDPDDLLDFSANLNPLGPPPSLLRELVAAAHDVAGLARYPDPDARSLREALARQLDVEPEAIVVGNGAAALLGSALVALETRRCVVPTPAFSEDRHAVALARARWVPVRLEAERGFALAPGRVLGALEAAAATVALITNPHNPSGALVSRETMLRLAHAACARGATTIVDEAFIDYAPEASVSGDAATTNGLVVIRSLTKFFAVPALRVGYAVAEPALARRLRGALPSWPVTTLAARALEAALADADFARRTLAETARARATLVAGLRALGFAPLPAAANFVLVELPPAAPRAPKLAARLVRQAHVVVRDCSSYEGLAAGDYIRLAVRSDADNARLLAGLAQTLAAAR